MPFKDPLKYKEYQAQWRAAHRGESTKYYHANKEKCKAINAKYVASHIEQVKERDRIRGKRNQRKTTAIFAAIKLAYGCCNPTCTHRDNIIPRRLHFHHLENKLFNIGMKKHFTQEVITEIKKCTVLCIWCHTAYHNNIKMPELPRCNIDDAGKVI